MRKRMMFILITLLLLASAGSHGGGGIHVLAALLLYPFAVLLVLAVLASPFIYAIGGWLLWCRLRDGKFPVPTERTVRWLRDREPFGYRLRLERVKPRQPTSSA